MARSISTSAERGFNLLARVGGEEFAILFPGATLEEAARLCDGIREAIACESLALNDEALALTVSLGVTEIGPDDELDASLTRADRALYAAKQKGRNRVDTAA